MFACGRCSDVCEERREVGIYVLKHPNAKKKKAFIIKKKAPSCRKSRASTSTSRTWLKRRNTPRDRLQHQRRVVRLQTGQQHAAGEANQRHAQGSATVRAEFTERKGGALLRGAADGRVAGCNTYRKRIGAKRRKLEIR